MRNYKAKDVEEYIVNAAEEGRPHLRELRRLVKETVPEAEESISWGVPFYTYHGLLAGFSIFKNHVTFGLAFVLQDEVRKALEKKGYGTGIKTVQIRFDQKVPATEIKQILKAKAKENEVKRGQ